MTKKEARQQVKEWMKKIRQKIIIEKSRSVDF